MATYSTSTLSATSHPITAVYLGSRALSRVQGEMVATYEEVGYEAVWPFLRRADHERVTMSPKPEGESSSPRG